MNVIRSRDIWGIFWLLAVSCPRRSIVALVDSLSLCDDWKYLEVVEKSDDNTFTCTGLREQQDVAWLYSGNRMATCPPPPSSCTLRDPSLNTIFRFSRTLTTASNITVLATAAPSLDYFGTTSLTCESTAQESVTCLLDSVYPAENITCKIQFNGETWEVTGWCLVSKVRSTRNKYGCYLYQTQGSQESVRVGSFSMSTEASTPSGYFSGTCNMTSYLPSDGRYSYTVLIMPGKVNVPAVLYGNNEIRKSFNYLYLPACRPKSIPYHNCPLYVREDNSVSCVCSVDDLGSPPGQLKWNNMSSGQLVLPGVKMDQHGVNYVCSLTWNRTVVQSVTYTLLVAYPPTQMSFKLNIASENVVVTEKSPVTMLCQSDGRPTPNMTITDVTNGNRVVHSQPGGNVTLADQRVQTQYDKATVECEDTGEYRCSADNIIGSRYQAVTLFVMCAPRRNPADANYTIPNVEGGKSVTIELIAYPTSLNVTTYFLGPNISSDEQPAKEGIFLVGCNASPPPSYRVICTITVTNVTSDTAGFYKVVVINQAGNVSFAFHALPRNLTGIIFNLQY
ncbi:uncharacterized protein LOC112567629 [Pomacea canaliculata]|uniref:uncharacterized protein LOC112567629 n=1 Tax=Pomacea canaliculata TaxID=400727 RepID=UPI000D729736|nr:uncharacterized protein LOC112567629 [Pomacea canaliculata]